MPDLLDLDDAVVRRPHLPTLGMLAKRPRGDDWVLVRSLGNLDIILEHDPRYAGRIRWCEFTHRVLVDGEPLQDAVETEISLDIEAGYGLSYSEERVHKSLAAVAARHPVHPVREYLESLQWDGVPRLDRWLVECCGVDPSERLAAPAGRRFLVASVARILSPGCKVDTVLILVGAQGARKSTAFKVLFGEDWFSDTAIDVRNKDALQALDGNWCIEWAELDSLRRSEATAVKAYITSAVDKYRPPYGRNLVERPRQCVFVGSTNERQFLADPTGSRRFWALPVTREIAPGVLASRRDLLWAEAVHRYRKGEQWWLDEEEDAARAEDAERFAQGDAWQDLIEDWLAKEKPDQFQMHDLLRCALSIQRNEINRATEMRVASLLQALGWERCRLPKGPDGRRPWGYRRTP